MSEMLAQVPRDTNRTSGLGRTRSEGLTRILTHHTVTHSADTQVCSLSPCHTHPEKDN